MPSHDMSKFLYTILKQLDLKSVDWNQVARELGVTNGHASRMRYSRFKQQMEGHVPTRRNRAPGQKRVTKKGTKQEDDKGEVKVKVDPSAKEEQNSNSSPALSTFDPSQGSTTHTTPEPVMVKLESQAGSMATQQPLPALAFGPETIPRRMHNVSLEDDADNIFRVNRPDFRDQYPLSPLMMEGVMNSDYSPFMSPEGQSGFCSNMVIPTTDDGTGKTYQGLVKMEERWDDLYA
ncbi:MAG: hypothetical protein M1818_002383 [Claussenomyces sp. TS43310]|nr:MAG: hypothetical protein M1818_002383 [Claussenomyces sp. TS43310]